jgi:RimJ/RimL family protein N-acetyltransferase
MVEGVTIETITTPRMRGERLGPQHLELLVPVFGDPRVGATMGGVQSPEVVLSTLEANDEAWERDGVGLWMFYESATGAPVARGGLAHKVFDGEPVVEAGWTTFPERWGEGFATELGQAALDVAFGPLALDNVVSYTLPFNVASRRVMEKLGFVYEKTAPYRTFGDHVLYRRMCKPADKWA